MNFLAWIVAGLIAGWLAGQVMKGGGYGVLVDLILGILGGFLGGWIFGLLGIGAEKAVGKDLDCFLELTTAESSQTQYFLQYLFSFMSLSSRG